MVAIVTVASKGGPLTNAELDANFVNLNNGKLEGGTRLNPNILYNGSAEFGNLGWFNNGTLAGYATGGQGQGTYWYNQVALTNSIDVYEQGPQIPCAANQAFTLSAEIYTSGMTAGSAHIGVDYLDSSGNFINGGVVMSQGPGSGFVYQQGQFTTPAGCAYVRPYKSATNSTSASLGGIAWRRIKIEVGNSVTPYSQEANWNLFGGSPPVKLSPIFQAVTVSSTLYINNTANSDALDISGSGTNGAIMKMIGNGSTTPSKTFQVANGILRIINDAFSANIFQLDDAGNCVVPGVLNGTNNPNLCFNGSGELGAAGWTLSSFANVAADTTGGIGSFFTNTSAITTLSADQRPADIPYGPSNPISLSIDLVHFATAGTVTVQLDAFNSAGTYISTVGSVAIPSGGVLKRYAFTGVTPANTSFVRPIIRLAGVTAAAFGVVLRRLKVERTLNPSLYSQEASIAAVGRALIASQAANSANGQVFLLPAGFSSFELEMHGMIPVNTASPGIGIQVSTDGGTTWQTTNYSHVLKVAQITGTSVALDQSTGNDRMSLFGTPVTTGAYGYSGRAKLYNAASTNTLKPCEVAISGLASSGAIVTVDGVNTWVGGAGVINAIRLVSGSTAGQLGFSAGTFRLYGLP